VFRAETQKETWKGNNKYQAPHIYRLQVAKNPKKHKKENGSWACSSKLNSFYIVTPLHIYEFVKYLLNLELVYCFVCWISVLTFDYSRDSCAQFYDCCPILKTCVVIYFCSLWCFDRFMSDLNWIQGFHEHLVWYMFWNRFLSTQPVLTRHSTFSDFYLMHVIIYFLNLYVG